MIKIKINDILNSVEVLQKLSETKLKAKLAWQVGRLLKATDVEIQQFNDARMNLIKKYGEKDENGELITDEGGNCRIVPEHSKDFSNELNELINEEVEINANKLVINDLEELDFTPAEMANLESYIDFEE